MAKGGARAGAGRKSKAEEAGLQKLLDECWTLADRKTTIKQLAIQSRRGNQKATELLMAYTYGKPKERIEHSGDNEQPIKIIVEYADDQPAAPASGAADDQA